MRIGERQCRVTVSIGVANYPLQDAELRAEEDIIRMADEALYDCMRHGRNRVSLYQLKTDG